MEIITKAGLALIKNGKILLVQEDIGPFWLMPGGTIKEEETPEEALKRKTENELGTELDTESIRYINEFEDAAAGKEDTMVKIKLYLGKTKGEPIVGPGITKLAWFDSDHIDKDLSPIIKNKILPFLVKENYIK